MRGCAIRIAYHWQLECGAGNKRNYQAHQAQVGSSVGLENRPMLP
jgi:hypothetical protein